MNDDEVVIAHQKFGLHRPVGLVELAAMSVGLDDRGSAARALGCNGGDLKRAARIHRRQTMTTASSRRWCRSDP
jgi:hypothetical protein